MNKVKAKAVTAVLACTMAMTTLAGCGKVDGTQAALIVNGETINLGTAEFYLRYQQAQSTTMMTNYGMSTESVWAQEYSGATSTSEAKTYGDSLKESIRKNIVQGVILKGHAEEYDVTISDNLKEEIKKAAKETYETNKEAMDKIGTTEGDIETVLELSTYQRLMYYPMAKDVDTNVSDEEAAESTITYAKISLTKKDSETGGSETMTDDEKKAAKKLLEDLLEKVKTSSDPAKADVKSLASQLDDSIEVSEQSFTKDSQALPEAVLSEATELKDGELHDGIIETDDAYYIVRMDKVLDREATDSNKKTIIEQRRETAYNDLVEKWYKEAKIKEEGCWKKLKVSDEDGYVLKTTPVAENTTTQGTDISGTSAVSSAS
ncbi:MAG: peptidyl-prolyl cis-trans isomerase [Eubacterium sp.]|nr:peptidyl-prolyl cis-trans isomerase [Eubacterium sp.]